MVARVAIMLSCDDVVIGVENSGFTVPFAALLATATVIAIVILLQLGAFHIEHTRKHTHTHMHILRPV